MRPRSPRTSLSFADPFFSRVEGPCSFPSSLGPSRHATMVVPLYVGCLQFGATMSSPPDGPPSASVVVHQSEPPRSAPSLSPSGAIGLPVPTVSGFVPPEGRIPRRPGAVVRPWTTTQSFHRVRGSRESTSSVELGPAQCEEEGYNLRNASVTQRALYNNAVLKIVQLLGHLRQFTILQSEDPGWFLGRAFNFTSRTSSKFIGAFGRNYFCNIAGVSFLLRGKRLRAGPEPLISDLKNLERDLLEKWTSLSTTIGIASREMDEPMTHSEAEMFMSETAFSLAQRRKDGLPSLLSSAGKKDRTSSCKGELISKVLEHQTAVRRGTQHFQYRTHQAQMNRSATSNSRKICYLSFIKLLLSRGQ